MKKRSDYFIPGFMTCLLLLILTATAIDIPLPKEFDFHPEVLEKSIRIVFGHDSLELREIADFKGEGNLPGKFFGVYCKNSITGYAYAGRVNSCRAGGCNAPILQATAEESEYFDYFVLYDSMCVVRMVKVYNYQASHGQEITARGWLKQFRGYKGTDTLEVGKQIDAISGATISVIGLVNDIREKSEILQRLKKAN